MIKAITLLLALLIVGNINLDDYSINSFLNYLHENGYYELIYEIKCQYGSDVANECCFLLFESVYCEEVVRVYMSKCPSSNPHSDKSLKDLIIKILELLQKKMSPDEINRFVKKLNAIMNAKKNSEKILKGY